LNNIYEIKWLNADMICIVFDITNKDSFGHSKFWLDKVKEVFQDNKKVIGCLIGNKSDLDQRRLINQTSAKQFSESIHMKYFECSAVIN
jgi:Ras-related protein Rab-1A